ncbi:common-antigen outer membrane protein [Amphritea atlantica]|uniref:Common-antigen outer membrane protein n=3 Tax=Amphritea atlantica TaxID=355243 RepID=A0A1H9K8P9_9GAMM|nr:common-antigen outer membrane protein [Amphritea atlantica]
MKLSTARIVNSVVVLFLVTFLSACTPQAMHKAGPGDSFQTSVDNNVLPRDVSQILSDNSQDFSLTIPAGMFQGGNLMANATYFAASGRSCRRVVISDNLSQRHYLACTVNDTQWELIPVTL